GGRPTTAEDRVLAKLRVDGLSPTALVASATRAVRALDAAGALRSRDIRAPAIYPRVAFAHAGQEVTLRYSVLEDSERSSDVATIADGSTQLDVVRLPMQPAVYTKLHTVTWRVPDPAPKDLRFCVVATDPSGNRGKETCVPIKLL